MWIEKDQNRERRGKHSPLKYIKLLICVYIYIIIA